MTPGEMALTRQPDRVPVYVGEAAAGAGRGGGHHVVNDAEPLAERGDGRLVGEVDRLGADARLGGVGVVKCLLAAAGHDELGSLVPGGEHDGAREPASPADDEHGLVFQ
jgi:hypothetical protein